MRRNDIGMKNQHLKNLNKIEFVVTDACTGRCIHCSQGEHPVRGAKIDPDLAAETVRRVSEVYELQTVMTFGGEPLLHPDAVERIMAVATELAIPRRQLITNGYFSRNGEQIRRMAERLAACGVNDLLLSVDAFHQETIPLEVVMQFAKAAVGQGIPVRLQPAWLVSATDDNPYNAKTRELLAHFFELAIPVGEGNVIFPEGRANQYLTEYFADGNAVENPYVEDPRDLRCLSVSPNGEMLGGNLYRQDVMEIIRRYHPSNQDQGGTV